MSNQPKDRLRQLVKKLTRSELNLEQYSVFTVSTYRGKSRRVVRLERLPSGEIVKREMEIGKTVDEVEVGILNINHFKVFLALVELWDKAGRPVHDPVHFTTLKLMRRLGMRDSGYEYRLIRRWLWNLREVPIHFINSFYVSALDSYRELKNITILSYLHVYERKYSDKQGDKKLRGYGEFQFDRHLLESLLNNYVHPLSLDVILSFKKHRELAILLYTYLDRMLAFKDRYEITLEKLFEHLDLTQQYVRYPSDRKAVVQPVLRELEGKPLSTGILAYCRIRKTKSDQDYKLIAVKKSYPSLPGQRNQDLKGLPTAPSGERIEAQESELFKRLLEEGLTESQARELLRQGEQVIRLQLEALPFRLKRYEGKKPAPNKAAILYQAIKENWSLPREYWEAKEREEREKRAKHYVLWQCKGEDCPCATTIVKRPKEKGLPERCPKCGSPVEVLNEDYKVYNNA